MEINRPGCGNGSGRSFLVKPVHGINVDRIGTRYEVRSTIAPICIHRTSYFVPRTFLYVLLRTSYKRRLWKYPLANLFWNIAAKNYIFIFLPLWNNNNKCCRLIFNEAAIPVGMDNTLSYSVTQRHFFHRLFRDGPRSIQPFNFLKKHQRTAGSACSEI